MLFISLLLKVIIDRVEFIFIMFATAPVHSNFLFFPSSSFEYFINLQFSSILSLFFFYLPSYTSLNFSSVVVLEFTIFCIF